MLDFLYRLPMRSFPRCRLVPRLVRRPVLLARFVLLICVSPVSVPFYHVLPFLRLVISSRPWRLACPSRFLFIRLSSPSYCEYVMRRSFGSDVLSVSSRWACGSFAPCSSVPMGTVSMPGPCHPVMRRRGRQGMGRTTRRAGQNGAAARRAASRATHRARRDRMRTRRTARRHENETMSETA